MEKLSPRHLDESARLSGRPLILLMLGLATILSLFAPQFDEPEVALNLAVGLYGVTALLWVWHRRSPTSARWAAVISHALLAFGAMLLFRRPQILFFSCLVTGYASAMMGLKQGAAVAMGQIALFVAMAAARRALWADVAYATALNLGVLSLVAAIIRPIYTLTYWAHQRYDQARALLEEARDRQAELKEVVDALAHANRELSLAHDRLTVLRLIAEDARRTKASFVANVSHEFRAPLNIIVGMAEILMDAPNVYGQALPAAAREDLEILHRNCEHLADLVNDVLDLSQIEADRLSLRREWVSIPSILESAVQIVRPLAQKKGLAVDLTVSDGIEPVYCDPRRIRQVILNLVSNAARFTEIGGIHVKTWVENKDVYLSVQDTGPGISPADVDRIFQPFQQSATAGAVLGKGSGLGLAVSREFVKMHEGALWVESSPGQGSTFIFRLPIAPSPEPLASAVRWVNEDWSRRTSNPLVESARLADRALLLDSTGQLMGALSRYADELELIGAADAREIERDYQNHAVRTVIVGAQEVTELTSRMAELRARIRGIPLFGFLLSRSEPAELSSKALAYITKPVSREDLRRALSTLPVAPKRILIVDDERDARRVLATRLESFYQEIEIQEAASAPEALDVANEWLPDAILLDLVMPETDGWEMLEEIGRRPNVANIPIILITGRDRYQEPLGASLLMATTQDGISLGKLVDCYRAVSDILLPRSRERGKAPRESSDDRPA